ncbi:MAG: hypothetical protein FWC43_00410 [Planctomycetaceae bacterium]|nr:hypothetical protein [Planctomycetaceae bacterium]
MFHAVACAVNAQGPPTLYEMVPHVVLPQTIQYRPMPTSLSHPGTYTAYTNYPATYTAYPSYVLPYPTEMRPVQQAVYPVTQPMTQQPVAQQPALAISQSVTTQPVQGQPVPALPRAIQKKIPYREIDVYTEGEGEESSEIMQMDFSSSIESFLSKKDRYSLVQWSNPAENVGLYPPYANYANPYPQANNPGSASTPALSPEVLNQMEQLLQKNPNMQFSAVMTGPNGQLIPLGGIPAQQAVQQPTQQQQMQYLQTQMQYIQAMNQYVQQLNAARMTPHCASPYYNYPGNYPGFGQYGGYAPYVQPIPGGNGAYALANPYYLAMYQSLYGGYGQQSANYYGYGGYGPMFNPYLPAPQGYYGAVPDQKEKSFRERMQERRKKGEKQMCDAWRTPHYPEETGMRMPAKNAYPWGYFGAQTAPQETPNYGGYYGMYFGSSNYPGQ